MKSLMKFQWLVLLSLSLSLSGAVLGQDRWEGKQVYEERFERTVEMAPDGTFSLGNIAGDIRVNSTAGSRARISAVKVSRAATLEEARENATAVTIQVTEEAGNVRATTEYPRGANRNLNVSVDYEVEIPVNASLDVSSVSGDVRVSNCGGDARLKSVSGDIQADGIGGLAHVESVSGDVTIRAVDGEALGKTVSGDVRMELSGGPVTAESVSGDLRIAQPGNTGFEVDASTFSGRINSDFQLSGNARPGRERLAGTVNGGGEKVRLKTFSGNIELSRNGSR
jgi:DUF4097 and DUF4098 domain-containing protein YvlB